MNRSTRLLSIAALLALLSLTASAQQRDEAPFGYSYATYFECDVTQQWLVDGIVENIRKPIYDKAVDDGKITGWGWLAHHTGGHWRRLQYFSAPTLDALFDAQEMLGEAMNKDNADAVRQMGTVCNSHDDYIWKRVAGKGTDARGEAGSTIYFECNQAKEDRADEIVNSAFKRLLGPMVEPGKLASWGWHKHVIGGKYRRLLTMTGSDHKTVIKMRDAFVEKMRAGNRSALTEFSEICPSHQDYLWDIQHEKP